jgi:hypothetical protein
MNDIILNSILNIFVFLVIFVLPVWVIGTVITEIYKAYFYLKHSNHE